MHLVAPQRALFNKFWIVALSMLTGAALFGAISTSMNGADSRRGLTRAIDASVQVFTERDTGGRRAGSAVILAPAVGEQPSLIITTAHTFEPMVEQEVFIAVPPSGERVKAEVLALDGERDLALLAAPIAPIAPVPLSEGAYLVDPMWVIAFPWGRARTVVNGAVSQLEPDSHEARRSLIRGPVRLIDASVSYGMSGGGVFDSASGRLVGLVQGYRTAQLSLPSSSELLKLPVAGETTVISTAKIACFLAGIEDWRMDGGTEDLVALAARTRDMAISCKEQETGAAAG